MTVYPIDQTSLTEIEKSHDQDKPIFMLNLWRFRPTALYAPEHAHLSPGPCTGREATERYRAAIASVLPPNAAVQFLGGVEGVVAGPHGETWDWVVVVRYESLKGFRSMVTDRKYKEEIEPHRLAGLEEWRLIAMDGIAGVGVGVEAEATE